MFTCHMCNKTISNRFNLKRHLSEIHKCNDDIPTTNKSKQFICTVCKIGFGSICKFENHLLKDHQITLNTETKEFSSLDDFKNWKKRIEDVENVYFIKTTSSKKLKFSDSYVLYFNCNRTGTFKSSSKGKRGMKIQGSCKIGGFCPSRMKAKVSDEGTVTVNYCSSHVGHGKDLSHKTLSLEERHNIAIKIANKVPFDTILDDIHSSVSKDSIHRIDIITRQDLYNIEREFNLNDTVRRSNEPQNVETWVKKVRMSNRNCILLHKPKGEETREFDKDDFCLGIMTEAQQEFLNKFGKDCICFDSTRRINEYDCYIITVMVIDDMRRGFPCAFYITNKADSVSIAVFLKEIKNKVGPVKPHVFMSDITELFYDAWVSVMGPVEKRLYCTWHVDKAWQSNLKKIRDHEIQKQTYIKLKALLEETNENTFMAMLHIIIQELCSNKVTKDFGEYFKSQYGGCFKSWAYCHRNNLGINTNLHLESMHRSVEYLFFNGKSVKRLDKAIHAIMQMTKQKLFDRLLVIEKGNLTIKIKELRTCHNKSLKMSTSLVTATEGSSWEIASASSTGPTYTVRLVEPKCDCQIVCIHCSSCIHKFSCTCIDWCIKWNMCKHVHLVCRKLKLENSEFTSENLNTEENQLENIEFEEMCDTDTSCSQNKLVMSENRNTEENQLETLEFEEVCVTDDGFSQQLLGMSKNPNTGENQLENIEFEDVCDTGNSFSQNKLIMSENENTGGNQIENIKFEEVCVTDDGFSQQLLDMTKNTNTEGSQFELIQFEEICNNDNSLSQKSLVVSENPNTEEKQAILREIGIETVEDKSVLVHQLKQKFELIIKKISTCNDVHIVSKFLKNLDAKLNSTKKHCIGQLKVRRNCNINQNIEPQRLYSSKKRNDAKLVETPSTEEALKILLDS